MQPTRSSGRVCPMKQLSSPRRLSCGSTATVRAALFIGCFVVLQTLLGYSALISMVTSSIPWHSVGGLAAGAAALGIDLRLALPTILLASALAIAFIWATRGRPAPQLITGQQGDNVPGCAPVCGCSSAVPFGTMPPRFIVHADLWWPTPRLGDHSKSM